MGKDLHTLIRLAEWTVDEKRRALSALHAKEEQLIALLRTLEAQLAAEQAQVRSNMAQAVTWAAFYDHHSKRRDSTEKQLAEVRRQIEAARDELGEAYRELKSFETAQATRDRKAQEERDRKERIFLDEIGQQRHRRMKEEQG